MKCFDTDFLKRKAEFQRRRPRLKRRGQVFYLLGCRDNAHPLRENSKWKMSFIDLEGRQAVISHNSIDFKHIVKELDPRAREVYGLHINFIEMTIRALNDSANNYRLKYELTTNKLDDFKMAILLLATLKRLYSYIGKKKELEEVQKRIDVWKAKLQSDMVAQEKKAKENRLR